MKVFFLILAVFIGWFFFKIYLNLRTATKQRQLQEQDFDTLRSNVCQICGRLLDEATFKRSDIFCQKCRRNNSPEYLDSCRTEWKSRQMKWAKKSNGSNEEAGHATWKDIYQSNSEWREYYEEELIRYSTLSPLAKKMKLEALREYMEQNPDDPPCRDLEHALQSGFNRK